MLDSLQKIPRGFSGTKKTIREMSRLVNQSKKNRVIINTAQKAVRNVPERDAWGEPEAILAWVQDNIRFVNDVNGVETLRWPEKIITESRAGDCDDLAVLFNAMCEAIGYKTAFKTIKCDPRTNEFSHVYSIVWINGQWIPADPSQDYPLGWEPPIQNGATIWKHDGGILSKKGNSMLGAISSNGIKQKILNLMRGQKQQQPTVAAPEVQAVSPRTDEIVGKSGKYHLTESDFPDIDMSLERENNGIYDKEKYSYYSEDNTTSGTYSRGQYIPLYDPEEATIPLRPLRPKTHKHEANRNLSYNFQTEWKEYPPNNTGIEEATPNVRPREVAFGRKVKGEIDWNKETI